MAKAKAEKPVAAEKPKVDTEKLQKIADIMEQLAAIEAKDDFWKFCKYYDPGFFKESRPHLKLIAEKLQSVADGKTKKLAISLPPRAGKSYTTSLFCAWLLGRDPRGSIMRNSYGADLAEKFSKDIRDGILVDPKYLKVFPNVRMSKKNTAVDGWSLATNTQPSYFCAGVGGAITGKGCRSACILDDPLKNIEEALSETTIESLWNWYTSTHLSRREMGCPEIHIATRWSKKDPIGRLTDPYSPTFVPDMSVVKIPALDENGRSYCEEIITTEELLEIRRITDPMIWEAEWMQNPIEEKGLLYAPTEMHRYGGALKNPDGIVAYVDTADVGSDFLCMVIGYRYGAKTYVDDVVFSQDGMEITLPQVLLKLAKHQCRSVTVESNAGGVNFARDLRNKIRERGLACSVLWHPNTKNKETRILTQSAYIKEYFWFRDDYAPGSDYDKFFRQMTSYVKLGKNAHDDAVDACTGLAELVPYQHFPRSAQPNGMNRYNSFEYDTPTQAADLGEITPEYLDFMGG